MTWRIVVISSRAKLDLRLNTLVVRGERSAKIHLGEIALLMIENTAVSLTAALIAELSKRKIKVVFCDEKCNPCCEAVPYYGSHDTSAKIKDQMKWRQETKLLLWSEIVAEKIRKQRDLLKLLDKAESAVLDSYIQQIRPGDTTNREGHAAKVYFNAIFGMDFTRTADSFINAALNYGYTVLLAAFNREIVANGYLTQLGLFHDNMFNYFNLSSDLMEPFRPLIDKTVLKMPLEQFEHQEKLQLLAVLNQSVYIDGKQHYVNNAIKYYCRSIFDALNNDDVGLLRFYRNEL